VLQLTPFVNVLLAAFVWNACRRLAGTWVVVVAAIVLLNRGPRVELWWGTNESGGGRKSGRRPGGS